MNNRRKLVIALGASAITVPFSSFAQQQVKVWRIGFLWQNEQSVHVARFDAFKVGMRELGYSEGGQYVFVHRSAQNDLARLPALAAELIALKVDLIVTQGTPSTVAARNATREIPILIVTVGDPVGNGLAASLRRPGGNVTGLTNSVGLDVDSKRLDLLYQMLPGMRRVGILYNLDAAAEAAYLRQFEVDCAKLKLKSIRAPVRKAEELSAAFKTLQRERAQGLIVGGGSSNLAMQEIITAYAARYKLPAIYNQSSFTESGGLISYAANYLDLYRRAAAYADKIFKGAKPGDLPIEQPTKFEFVLNMKTAKALGIKFPNSIMVQATKVID